MIQKLNLIKLTLISLSILINFASSYQPVLAHLPKNNNIKSDTIKIRFNQKQGRGADRGRPTRRRGMASRDNCPVTDIPLTALIPENDVSKVIEPNPTFWFFIPYQASKIPRGEFVVQDEQNKDIYRVNFPVRKGEGIISISLDNPKYLEKNKTYQWYFKLFCDANDNERRGYQKNLAKPIFVKGWVQRVILRSQQQKQLDTTTSPRQRIAFYAENGIWYSALTELAKQLQTNPQAQEILLSDWFQLLSDVGLQELSNIPILGDITKYSESVVAPDI